MNPDLYNSGYHLVNPTCEIARLESENDRLRAENIAYRRNSILSAEILSKQNKIRNAELETVIASLRLELRVKEEALKLVASLVRG